MDEKKEPTLLQQRKKDLFFAPTNGYDRLAPGERRTSRPIAPAIRPFWMRARPSGSAWTMPSAWPEAAGFRPLVRGEKLRPGDKVYRNNRGKSLLLAVIGQESLNQGR